MEKESLSISIQRDRFADFLKYALIWIVVLIHFINPYQRSAGPIGGLNNCLYTFCMPLFVFISGYFSKHINSCRRKNVDTILYPFVLFQFINIVYTLIIPLESLSKNIFYPYHQNWYLIALFWWRTITPYKQFYKDYIVITISFIICLGVGFFPEWSGFLGLYKTAYFLPFFILGSYCEDLSRLIDRLMKHKVLWLILLGLIMMTIFVFSFNKRALVFINYAFKANVGYEGELWNVFARMASICISLLVCCSILVLLKLIYEYMNSKRINLSGGGTILAFLGHEFIMIPLNHFYVTLGSLFGFLLCFFTSILIVYILTREALVKFFSPLLDLSVLCDYFKLNIYKNK